MRPADPFDRLVGEWLATVAPATVPDDLHRAVVDGARRTRQRRPGLQLPFDWTLVRSTRLALDLAAVLVLAIAGLNLLASDGPGVGPVSTSPPTAGPSPTAQPTATSPAPPGSPDPEVDPEWGDYSLGRHALVVDGIAISFDIQARRWESYEGFLISKSIEGPQGAEAVIFWAGYPDGDRADPCLHLTNPIGLLPELVTEAVAEAPGTDLLAGPVSLAIDGRAASRVVVRVREDVGCDPGFFYNWKAQTGGALWTRTAPGDVIRVWVVQVGTRLLFIGALTSGDTNPVVMPELEAQIAAIVDSMRFE